MNSWWPSLSLSYRAPLSGDVTQDIAQSMQLSGDRDIELEVYKDAGSPGRQLGRLTDAVLDLEQRLRQLSGALAERDLCDQSLAARTKVFDDLMEIATEVDKVKERHGHRLKDRAQESMERLRKADSAGFKALMKELNAPVKGKG